MSERWLTILTAAATVLGMAATIGGAVGKWFFGKINGLGGRVDKTELKIEALTTRLEMDEKKMQYSEFDRAGLHESHGRLETSIKQVIDTLEKRHDARENEYKEIRERLIRIEAKSDAAQSMEAGLTRIADIMEKR
jgi:hypothetical protein